MRRVSRTAGTATDKSAYLHFAVPGDTIEHRHMTRAYASGCLNRAVAALG
jgi:hypothetical protein